MGWTRGRGVILVYNVTNEENNCNREQAKEIKTKKKKSVKTIQIYNKCILNR